MSEGNTTRIAAQEALRRIERGESLTDRARVRALPDAEVRGRRRRPGLAGHRSRLGSSRRCLCTRFASGASPSPSTRT
jgi:hypothetical protein